jgi:hypothetical protein
MVLPRLLAITGDYWLSGPVLFPIELRPFVCGKTKAARWVHPGERLLVRIVTYPEASPAAWGMRVSKDAGMVTCLSS